MEEFDYIASFDVNNKNLVGQLVEWNVVYYGRIIMRGLSIVTKYKFGEKRPFEGVDILDEMVRYITVGEDDLMHYSDSDRYVKCRVISTTPEQREELLRLKAEDNPEGIFTEPYPQKEEVRGMSYYSAVNEWSKRKEQARRNRPLMKYIEELKKDYYE